MKILLLSRNFPNIKQVNKGIFNLSRVKALKKIGCEIKVIAPVGLTPPKRYLFTFYWIIKIIKYLRFKKSIPRREIVCDIETFHPRWFWLPKNYFWKYEAKFLHIFSGKKIKSIIIKFKPNVIITSVIHPFSTYSKYIRKYYDGTIIAMSEGSDLLVFPQKYGGIETIIRDLNKYTNKVIFVSNNAKDAVCKKYNVKNYAVIKNGYDSDYFYYSGKNTENEYDIIKLISVGSLEYIKGHDILLKALKILGTGYYLKIIGDGSLRKSYENFVRKNKMNNMVEFLGLIEHNKIKKYLDKSMIYCASSRSESFGISVIEAMACGLPVVAPNIGAFPEHVIENFNGILYESNSPKSLSIAIKKAKNIKWNNFEISRWTKENYNWANFSKGIIKIIN